MKILLINGSPRKNGATAAILKEFQTQLTVNPDAQTSLIHLADVPLEYCKGCTRCYQTGTCFLKDGAEALSQQIAQSDAVIIGSPTYASSIPGQLKTMIDRGHFVIEQLLKDTYTLTISTYENAGGHSVTAALNKLFLYSGASLCGSLTIKTPFGSNPLEQPKLKAKIHAKSAFLYRSITKGRKKTLFQRIFHTIIFHIGIKPFVLKKTGSYRGVLNHWKDRGIRYEAL